MPRGRRDLPGVAEEYHERRRKTPVRFCKRTGSLRFGPHLRNLRNLWMVFSAFLVLRS